MKNELTVINEGFYASIKKNFISIADEKTFKREINFAIQILKKSPYLQKCDASS